MWIALRASFLFSSTVITTCLKRSPCFALLVACGRPSCASVFTPKTHALSCYASIHKRQVRRSRHNSPTIILCVLPIRHWLPFWAERNRCTRTRGTKHSHYQLKIPHVLRYARSRSLLTKQVWQIQWTR